MVHEIDIRELLLLYSIYRCGNIADMVCFVRDQPDTSIFYKSFLELDLSNMVSILAFDSRSMEYLLGSENSSNFESEYPIFFKNKFVKKNNEKKNYYRYALENAINSN